jgi:carbon starvation protein
VEFYKSLGLTRAVGILQLGGPMKNLIRWLVWLSVALMGAGAYASLALRRGEQLNSAYILVAALCTYAIGYRFYSKWISAQVLMLDNRRAPPAEVHDDGKDFVRTNKWIVFGHHFAAISGPGPLVGPVLAAQFGYLPGTLWILIGVVLGGAVQDFVILFASMRRNGKSLGQMLREELNTTAGYVGTAAILAIMIILLAVLALVVVKALAESPWGVFTVGATIPIAVLMGVYLRFWRVGRVLEASAFGIVLLLLAVWGGQFVHVHPPWAQAFTFRAEPLAWCIIGYGLAASVLPVWLLLAPRDYLSTFMKLGTILALVLGVFLVLPDLEMPAVTRFIDGSGPVLAGSVFPFCFITIACGSISGFHTLIASGVTPKIMTRENYARSIGYGAMCLESLVAIMAMVAACTLEPGVYLSMNIKGVGPTEAAIAADTVAKVKAAGFDVSVEQMQALADEIGEHSLFGRTGGAATLAVGMAHIFSKAVSGRWLDLWYHFAIMFEALFILTTLDAGTRVGRYLLHDVLGTLWKPLGNIKSVRANLLASTLMVAAWGYFLIQGVRDPLGGINSLWPLFGIANQLLASVALCLGTTILLKMHLPPTQRAGKPRPALALITLIPLVWLLSVTFTAGVQKVFHPTPSIGFLAKADLLNRQLPALEQALASARTAGEAQVIAAAEKAIRVNRTEHFNQRLDAVVASVFLVLVVMIVLLSIREWILLLARKRLAVVHETEPVWLPNYALAESRSSHIFSLFALAFALAKELSGEAQMDRAKDPAHHCAEVCSQGASEARSKGDSDREVRKRAYLAMTEDRFRGVRRCC